MRRKVLILLMLIGIVVCPLRCHLREAVRREAVRLNQDQFSICLSGCCAAAYSLSHPRSLAYADCYADSCGDFRAQPSTKPAGRLPTDCGCLDCICCGAIVAAGHESILMLGAGGDWTYPLDFRFDLTTSCWSAQFESRSGFRAILATCFGCNPTEGGRHLRIVFESLQI